MDEAEAFDAGYAKDKLYTHELAIAQCNHVHLVCKDCLVAGLPAICTVPERVAKAVTSIQ